MKICKYHLCDNEVVGRTNKQYCSHKCINKDRVRRWRLRTKRRAIEYKGGKCEICGYNRCDAALQFHHRYPNTKSFGIAGKGVTRKWERVKEELDKCDLLCANCHMEVEYCSGETLVSQNSC